MLTGQIPNSHLQGMQAALTVVNTKVIKYVLPDETSKEMRALIVGLLGKETKDRPTAEEALAHEVFVTNPNITSAQAHDSLRHQDISINKLEPKDEQSSEIKEVQYLHRPHGSSRSLIVHLRVYYQVLRISLQCIAAY